MILYISAATSYKIYNRLFENKLITIGYQVQKFNSNIIKGLSIQEKVVALSALPYNNVKSKEIYENIDNVEYYCISNKKGRLIRKIAKINGLIKQGKKIIKKEKPQVILCDAIVPAGAVAALSLGRRYKIPTIAIITDIPGKIENNSKITNFITINEMKKYDGYILLTEQMNEIVNPTNKPFMIMEGSCENIPELKSNNSDKKIILYSGSLWRKNAGLEYFTEGFIKANLPDTELHFYGTGEFEEDLKEIEKNHPSIKYMGCITNAEMVQKQAEAFLLVNPRPSNAEFCKYSFPSKTFEYMVSGTPVLMTRLPGIPNEYFQYTYTIDKENADGVCDVLREIFDKNDVELEQKGLQARKFVQQNKNNIIQAKRIIDFIGSMH